MAKGGSSGSRSGSDSGNGGIAGSGIFGLFGTTIQCPASDTSLYCSFMKIFNVFIVLFFVLAILYTIYSTVYPYTKNSRSRR